MRNLLFWSFAFLVLFSACEEKHPYKKMESEELASGIRNDSLFLGFYLGMTKDDFYTACWDLNDREILKQGGSNLSVEYKTEELNYPAVINFYPVFCEEKVCAMPMKFGYDAWAPWNKKMGADSLEVDVMDMFIDWYGGNEFVEVPKPEGKQVSYVKIDGNRRITVMKDHEWIVKALISDLTAQKK